MKDIGWKETAGEAVAFGLVINIVSGKPLSLFLLRLAIEGTSVFVVIQVWLPYVHGVSTFVSSQTNVFCDLRYMLGSVIFFSHEVFQTGIISYMAVKGKNCHDYFIVILGLM